MTADYEPLAFQLANTEQLDNGTVRLGDGAVVYEYRFRQLRSRLAGQKGEATKRARREVEEKARAARNR